MLLGLGLAVFSCADAVSWPLAPGPVDDLGWYSELDEIRGVNLPSLDLSGWTNYGLIEHPDFVRNISKMGWNGFRTTLKWQRVVDADNQLVFEKIRENHALLVALVERLKSARETSGSTARFMLILNFHQFKFGPVCGGSGVPRGVIDETDLESSDPNCPFKTFERFWGDETALAGWASYVAAVAENLPKLARDNESWLTLGLNFINEPFAGGFEPLTDIGTLGDYLAEEQIAQIDTRLVPFYRRILLALEELDGVSGFLERTLLIFEPFALDHFVVSVMPRIDGDYSAMIDLQQMPGSRQPVRWLAAPHHYDGAYNPDVLSVGPSFIEEMLRYYPNFVFSKDEVVGRIELQARRFREAGMDMILGEWGTYATLLDEDGGSGGYRAWIADTQEAISRYTLGALWWAYTRDRTEGQVSFNLLRGLDDTGERIEGFSQEIKCSPEFEITELVFGSCVTP